MKINGEDLSISKEKNSRKTLLKIVITFLFIIIIFTLYEIFFIFKIKSNYDFNQEILNNGQKYEKSVYIKYKDKIYACVYGESYQLDDVDIESFKVLDSMDYSDSHVAVDKKSVYFGNISIPDLNPNTLNVIENNYYSDGINSYFCSQFFKKNENLANKSKIRQYIEYYFFEGEKPQEYSYPFKKVETNKSLKAVKNLSYFATDGEKVYYQGEVLENADLNTLRAVDRYKEYFADKENVYYKSKLLALSSNEKLKVVRADQEGEDYLYDGLNGNVFLEEYAFDKKYLPYQVLGEKSNHIRDLLFVNKDGIFFYNPETKEQERVRDNIFIGEIEEINPSVISDDKNIYYLHSYNVYKKKKTKYGYMDVLVSKNIGIFYLDEKKNWEKIKDIASGTTGQVWKKGSRYYYFDNLGVHQLIDDVVYEIVDNVSLKYLLETNNINDDTIRKFVRDKKLIAFKGEELTTASIKYKESHVAEIFLAVFLTTFFGIFILITYLNWKAQKKDKEKIDEERKKIEKQMEFWNNYYNNEEPKKEVEKIITSSKSYDDEEEIKKEIDKIKPIVKNYNDIEDLTKQNKKIDSIIKHYNDIEDYKKIDSIIKNYNDK
ncbi:DKNYY domain-containing protein [Fusobacterium nucleatum]|uniref:DKNYY domain-containing protein n=1 Tax=Fusobacterium nucleatum TaxID=851 RepID=UPI0030CD0602